MKINETLKPCPFCGSEVELSRLEMDQVGVTSIEVRCRCGAEILFDSDDYIYDWTDTPHQMGLTAIEKYNNRVIDEDAISRCELFNRLATIPAPPEANDFKAEIYKVIQSMEAKS